MYKLSMVGLIGVDSLAKAVMFEENVSPGKASSTYIGTRSPAVKVVFSPCERSKVERCISAWGTSEKRC